MLYHSDCLDVLIDMELESVDLIVADPPYGGIVNEYWDNIENYASFTRRWLYLCRRVLKPTGSIYVWCSIGPKSSSLLDIATELKRHWVFQDMIVWNKQRGRGNRRGWLFTREEVLWATKTKDYVWYNQYSTEKYHESWIKRLKKEENPYKRATNVWNDIDEPTIEMAKQSGGRGARKVLHKAQKPVRAIERIIQAHTKEGDLVLDPFGGSGTTGVAAANLNRKYIVVEKDQVNFNIMCERLGVCV